MLGALRYLFDERVRQFRRDEFRPRQFQGRAELAHEIAHPAIAAGQMGKPSRCP